MTRNFFTKNPTIDIHTVISHENSHELVEHKIYTVMVRVTYVPFGPLSEHLSAVINAFHTYLRHFSHKKDITV
jgi:hypothetical protein